MTNTENNFPTSTETSTKRTFSGKQLALGVGIGAAAAGVGGFFLGRWSKSSTIKALKAELEKAGVRMTDEQLKAAMKAAKEAAKA